jgi:type IV secretory pathway TraG/TraD family ATPase VirD4
MALYIDEFAQFVYIGITTLFAQGAGAGLWLHAFTQSLAGLTQAVGEDAAREIMDNTNTKIFMRVNDNATAEYIEEYAGTRDEFEPIIGRGGAITNRSVERPRIRQNDITTLPPRTFYYFGMNGRFKGRPEMVSPAFLNIRFPCCENG